MHGDGLCLCIQIYTILNILLLISDYLPTHIYYTLHQTFQILNRTLENELTVQWGKNNIVRLCSSKK